MSNPEPTTVGSGIPDPQLLRVDISKITDYLLNSNHAEGHSKARFFKAVGFSEEDAGTMIKALRDHAEANMISKVIRHSFGVKTIVECFIQTPSGKSYCIRTVWNDHLDGNPPKLVTAFPASV